MKSVCSWLVVWLSLVAATQAIKCYCDEGFCADKAAVKEGECPGTFAKDMFDKDPKANEEMAETLPKSLLEVEMFRRKSKGDADFTTAEEESKLKDLETEAKDILGKLSSEGKVRLMESNNEIRSIMTADQAAGKVDKSIYTKWVDLFDQARAGTYEPKHVDYNFCIKVLHEGGSTLRACGVSVAESFRDMEVGCHKIENPKWESIGYQKYCRCDAELCNSGDDGTTEEDNGTTEKDVGTTEEKTPSKTSKPSPETSTNASNLLTGLLMQVCIAVVMSQICRA